jgi:hypothetical protein
MPDAAYMAAEENLTRSAKTSRVLCAVIEIGWLTMTLESIDIVESLATDADMNAMRMPLIVTSVVDAISTSPMANRWPAAATELELDALAAPNTTRRADTAIDDVQALVAAPNATRTPDADTEDCAEICAADCLTTSAEALTLDAAENANGSDKTTALSIVTVLVLVMSAAPRLTP